MIIFLLLTFLAASCLGNSHHQDLVPEYWESMAPELHPIMKEFKAAVNNAHQTLVNQAEKFTAMSVCSKMNTTMISRARQALDCGSTAAVSFSDGLGNSDRKAIVDDTRSCIGSENDILCLAKKLASLVNTRSLGAVCSALREVESGLKTVLVIFCHNEPLGGRVGTNYQDDKSREVTKDIPNPVALPSHINGFDQWWLKQKLLKEQIRKTCKRMGPSLRMNIKQNELKRVFLYEPRHEMLYCRNNRAGSTTWLTHFVRLSKLSESEKKNPTHLGLGHAPWPARFQVPDDGRDLRALAKSTTSFSMVRHPFERLVSAYQDMSEGAITTPEYIIVRNFIKENYGEVNFPNFIHFILHESKSKCRSLKTCELDGHWLPYISRCAFCDIPYTVIAKTETFKEDQLFIGELAGVQRQLDHVQANLRVGGSSSSDLTMQLFSQLDKRTVERLFRLYQVDFEMFGYSADLYMP